MRRWQRWLSSWLPIAALLLTACQQPEPTHFEPPRVLDESPYVETGDFSAIQEHGRLRLLMVRRPDAVTHLPRAGSPVNTQLRAAARFARSVGLEPVVVLVDRFDQLIPALAEGRGDLIVANLPINKRHREAIGFSVALDRSRQMLVARNGDPIEAPADLDGRAITIGFDSRFWHTAQRLQEEYPGLEVHSLPALSTERKLDRLAAGDIDLTIVDGNALEVALGYRDSIRGVFPVSAKTGIGWGLRRDAEELKAILDRFITQRKMAEFDQPLRSGDLPAIKRNRTLRVATRNSAANYFVWRGQLLGFEYELARRFADHLGVRLEIIVADPEESLLELVRAGRADMAAAFLTPRNDSDGSIGWSRPYHFAVKRVVTDAGDPAIESIEDLSGRRIRVPRDSDAWETAERLRDEEGIDLRLEALPAGTSPEAAIRGVASGEYDLTLVDDHIARNAAAWRENVRSDLEIGDPVPHRWAFREDNGQLQAAADRFLGTTYRSEFYNVVYSKYFRDHDRIREFHAQRIDLDSGHQLSPWDDIIQRYAKQAGLDWRLVAAQTFQESGFDPNARSWAGARGLMQMMPATARQVGVTGPINDPEVNIRAGIQYLDWLRDRFEDDLRVQDRTWLMLAAFNAGIGHVRDARRLADRLGLDRDRWFDNVERAMRKLSEPEHYQNARYGYVRGHEPVQYVRAIRERYQAYILWTNDCWPSCQPNPHPAIADSRTTATPFGPRPPTRSVTSTAD